MLAVTFQACGCLFQALGGQFQSLDSSFWLTFGLHSGWMALLKDRGIGWTSAQLGTAQAHDGLRFSTHHVNCASFLRNTSFLSKVVTFCLRKNQAAERELASLICKLNNSSAIHWFDLRLRESGSHRCRCDMPRQYLRCGLWLALLSQLCDMDSDKHVST